MPHAGLQPRRACQVLTHHKVGSGYLVSGNLALTARHVVCGAAEVTARFVDESGRPREVPGRVVWADEEGEGLDLAVVRLAESLGNVVPVSYGRLGGRAECEAVGFPLFKLREMSPGRYYRDAHHAVGMITPHSNLRSGTLELTVNPPGPNPRESPWQGMSGAAVFVGGLLVGVLCEHHRDEGLNHLAARPVERWHSIGDRQRLAELCELVGLPLARALTPAGRPPVSPAVSRGLPRDIATFTGRGEQLERLTAVVDAAAGGVLAIHAVDGMAGVGKSAFAIHAAHRLLDRFPDGPMFLPLHAHTPGVAPVTAGAALGALLLGDGLKPSELPAEPAGREQLWRERTAGRRMLLVLDDAADAAQVRLLLPASAESLVLVTSRRRLTGLDDVVPISMGVLGSRDAADLFAATAGRSGLDPADPDVKHLVGLCGYLPLAVSLTAARLLHHPSWTPSDLIEEFRAADSRLQALPDLDGTVAVAFCRSYEDLSVDQQRLFRLLGAHPGVDFEPEAAAALLGSDIATARRLLMELDEHRLLDETVARHRWRMHDLLREHAAALATDDADSTPALNRLLTFYRNRSSTREGQEPGREAVCAWQRTERENLLACIEYAALHGEDAAVVDLTANIAGLLAAQGPWTDAVMLHAVSAEAARRIGDRSGQASALNDLGRIRRMSGDYVGAVKAHAEALKLLRDIGDRLMQLSTLTALGEAQLDAGDIAGAVQTHNDGLELLQDRSRAGQPGVVPIVNDLDQMQLGQVRSVTDDDAENEAVLIDVLEQFRGLGDRSGEAYALNGLGQLRLMHGDTAGAEEAFEEARRLYGDLGDRSGQASTLNGLGQLRRTNGDYDGAVKAHASARNLFRALGDHAGQASTLIELGKARLMSGDIPGAEEAFQEAQRLCRELGLPEV